MDVTTQRWAQLEYPLTVQELKRLSWLQTKMCAAIWLAERDHTDTIDWQEAKRLAFMRHLVLTGRLRESLP